MVLPAALGDAIDAVRAELGVSRSAFLAMGGAILAAKTSATLEPSKRRKNLDEIEAAFKAVLDEARRGT